MRSLLTLLVFLTATSRVPAQETRELRYHPEGRDIVCHNGAQRYTRALYGSTTDMRVETSDRPVFAIYKKGACRNVRFEWSCQAKTMPLDSAQQCEARYQGGRRTYRLSDPSWGGGILTVTVLAHPERETVVWRFEPSRMPSGASLACTVSKIRHEQMQRNGDLNADAADTFESSGEETLHNTLYYDGHEPLFVVLTYEGGGKYTDVPPPGTTAECLFDEAQRYQEQLSQRIVFDTPDPFLNPMGSVLSAAADGAWDGATWLHGAVAWRMTLPGWRGGYLGDVLGLGDRALSHFRAYAASQVRDVEPVFPHPMQDSAQGLSRALKRWGTPMYSDGYITRHPRRTDTMHHYDMNLVFIDALLWHFAYDADTALMREMWPVITSHLAWEKRNFDPDNDGLYDAYCCIWASDGLYYNGGGVTHSSAYNYRANRMAARIATLIGEDPAPYEREAAKTLRAMNERLWLADDGHWAEYQDGMGLRRTHRDAALWSIYTPIDCGACSEEQAWRATQYIDRCIPHIPVLAEGVSDTLYTLSSSDWMPYNWSINNVAAAEVMHTALAYFEAGRTDEGYRLLKANLLDFCYLGSSPGNFGQVSHYDKARGELYRDFTDHTGMAARALIQGLFGIVPDALNGRCIIRPGIPKDWKEASVKTPYLSYRFHREGDQETYEIEQHFARPLQIVLRLQTDTGYVDVEGSYEERQVIVGGKGVLDGGKGQGAFVGGKGQGAGGGRMDWSGGRMDWGNLFEDIRSEEMTPIDLSRHYNSRVGDIFANDYLHPRSPYTTLQIPIHGIGDWCHPTATATIDTRQLHTAKKNGLLNISLGIPFLLGSDACDIAYTSLWDNYPDSIVVNLDGHASHAYLLMAGSTNPMQSHIDNGEVVVRYADGTSDTLPLHNPHNWCPIEQDYYDDGFAFRAAHPRPYRLDFATGKVSRTLLPSGDTYGNRQFECGAGIVLDMPLDATKSLESLTLRTLSNDIVIGIMGITLQR